MFAAALLACTAPIPPAPREPSDPTVPPDPGACGAPAEGTLAAEPVDNGAIVTGTLTEAHPSTLTCAAVSAVPRWIELVPLGARWRIGPTGVPDDWTSPARDVSDWDEVDAPVGHGDPVFTTVDPTTAVFLRTSFTVDDPAAVDLLTATVRVDDWLAVWINGVEVARTAEVAVADEAERTLAELALDPNVLTVGVNTLAVEVHSMDAEDLSVDLRLAAHATALDPYEVHVLEADAGTAPRFVVRGLLADATYDCTFAVGGCPVATATVTVPPLAVPPPPLARRPGLPGDGGYTLFNHQRPCVDERANRLFVVDPDGRVRWHHELPIDAVSSIDIESAWLGDGTVLWGGGEDPAGLPQIVGLDHAAVHTAGYPGATEQIYHHDLERDPVSGEIAGLVTDTVRTQDLGRWDGFGIVAHDPVSQQVTWTWSTQDAVDRGQLWGPDPDQTDPYHANALARVDDVDGEGFYVSLLHADAVIRVDRDSGDVSWVLGRGRDFTLVDPSGAPLPDDAWFDGTHGMQVYGDRVFLYENGKSKHQSQVMVLTLDPVARTAERTWTWTEYGWFEPLWGDVDELPSGDVAVAMAHNWCIGGAPDHPGALLEVTPAGEVPWRLDFLDVDDATYRAQRIDGCALFANTAYCAGR